MQGRVQAGFATSLPDPMFARSDRLRPRRIPRQAVRIGAGAGHHPPRLELPSDQKMRQDQLRVHRSRTVSDRVDH